MLHLRRRIARTPWIAGEQLSLCHLRLLHDLTVSYLMNSCALSHSIALSLANRINLKTTKNAYSILALLRAHGFESSHIASIITKSPRILFSDAESNIKPKLEFFLSVGVSSDGLAILRCSLEKRLRRNFDMLKTICGSGAQLLGNICKLSWLLSRNFEKEIFPNMKTLRDHGVSSSNMVKLSILAPQVLLQNPARFSISVVSLKEMGFDLSALRFVSGLKAVCSSSWERKFQLYQSFGWLAEETIFAFKKFPFIMMISDRKIKSDVNFFVESVNCTPSFVATQPILLFFSLEKRVVPRHNVMNILASKGLKKNFSIISMLKTSEKRFLEKYVIKYKDHAPEVLVAYKDKIDAKGLKFNQ